MRIILLENILNIGKKHEIKEVSSGYARNYLLPRGKAKIADTANLNKLKIQQEAEKKRQQKNLQEIQETIKGLENLVLEVSEKVGEKGELFESITEQKIADLLGQQGFSLNKSQIELKEPIKNLGNYPIEIKLDSNTKAKIEVRVKAEN
jgi:large subunit ribosomal protein L9